MRKIYRLGIMMLLSTFFEVIAVAQSPTYNGIVYVTQTGAGNMSGDSWENALPSVKAAINAAPRYGATQVWVAAGEYTENTITLRDGISLYGGFTGNESDNFDLSQRNLSENVTILDGEWGYRVITQSSDFSIPTVVDGFTIQRGRDSFVGGALLRGNTTLSHCIVINNIVYGATPDNDGFYGAAGGLRCEGSLVSHCIIKQNAINIEGLYMVMRTCAGGIVSINTTISNCLITENNSNNGSVPGGIATSESIIVNSDIVNNFLGVNVYLHDNQHFINCVIWKDNSNPNISRHQSVNEQDCFSNCAISDPNFDMSDSNLDLQRNNSGYSGYGGWMPNFENPDSGDFRLRPMSILVDGGSVEGFDIPEYDLNGNPRVQQHGIDIGCYEFTNDGTYGYDGIVYVKPTSSGDSTGTSWANAVSDLQAAVNIANALGGNCQVWVAAGTYYGNKHGYWGAAYGMVDYLGCFKIREGVNVYGGLTGSEPFNYDLSLRNITTNQTILDGENLRRVLYQPYPFEIQTLWDGFVIQNGYDSLYSLTYGSHQAHSNENEILDGAGCYLIGNMVLAHCIIRNNRSSRFGGGVWAKKTRLSECIIYNNKTHSSDYTFGGGGGVYSDSALFVNCEIRNNEATDNSIYGGHSGGGVYVRTHSTFINCNISNNTASGSGGGVCLNDYTVKSSDFINCNIVSNLSSRLSYDAKRYAAGGLSFASRDRYYEIDPSIHIQMNNCIIWGNRSFENNSSQEIISNVTGYAVLKNCAIEEGYDGIGNITLSSQNNGTGIVGPRFVHPTVGAGASHTGGDWRLQSGSWLINRGDTSSLELPATDLSGGSRIQHGKVDIGCYESTYEEAELPQFPDHIIYVKQNGSGNKSGTSWDNAADDINYALAMAGLYDFMQVWVATGLYHGSTTSSSAFLMRENVNVYGGFAGNELADFDMSQRSLSSYPTVLDGQHSRRVLLQPRHFTKQTEWNGFTIQNGNAIDNWLDGGGVLLMDHGMISNCIIHNCEHYGVSMFCGGGVLNSLICNNNEGGINFFDYELDNLIYEQNSTVDENWHIDAGKCYNSTIVANEGGNSANHFRNSVIWGNRDVNGNIAVCSGFFDHCAVEGGYGSGYITLESANEGVAEFCPRFVAPTLGAGINYSGGDWRLQDGSVCINNGDTANLDIPSKDLLGNNRIQYGQIDIGCYESSSNEMVLLPQFPDSIVYVTQTGAGNMDGSSWSNAMSDINQALTYAAIYDSMKVWVAAGLYYGDTVTVSTDTTSSYAFYMRENVPVYGGLSGNEPADYDLSQRDFSQNQTILDGQNKRSVLVQIVDFNKKTLWDGLCIHHGLEMANGAAGCCIRKNGILRNCVISNNTNTGYGAGGVYVNGMIDNCVIQNNIANRQEYGYSIVGGLMGSGTVQNSQISNNIGYWSGGFIGYNVDMTNCLISNNTGVYFGAGYALYDGTFANCDFINNSDHSAVIGFSYGSSYKLANCILWGNRTNGHLSNLWIPENNLTVSHCAIEEGAYSVNIDYSNIFLSSDNDGNGLFHPRFVTPTVGVGAEYTGGNWQLQDGSACINRGSTIGLDITDLDLAGNPRIQQGRIDIGCYESLSSDTTTFVCDTVYKDIYGSFCKSFTWNDTVYTTSGDYVQNFQNENGCDSIVTLHLSILPNDTVITYDTLCGGVRIMLINASEDYLQENYYLYNHSSDTCQITYLYNNMVDESEGITIIDVDGEFWNGTYYDIVSTTTSLHELDCDSTYIHHNIIKFTDAMVTWDTGCGMYIWNGDTLTQSGTYEHYFTNTVGCDSVETLILCMRPSVYEDITDTAYDSYTFNGVAYYESGIYTQSLDVDVVIEPDEMYFDDNSGIWWWYDEEWGEGWSESETVTLSGCKIVTLNLTINCINYSDLYEEFCDSYVWNDSVYTTSGDYTQTFTAANGCDSVVTLHLTVNGTKHVEFADSTCTAYVWNGQTYTATGDYTQTFTAANGCDSVVTLHLTIVPSITPAISITGSLTACDSGSATLTVPGNYHNFVWSTGAVNSTVTVSEPGFYWVTATDVYGCEGVSEMVQIGGSVQIGETPAICMVGVENDHNLLVWETLADPDVVSYRIYRENSQANVFEPMVTMPANGTNAYEDTTANPSVRAWRYKITAVDSCGGETPMSEYHKTVHLTINQGLGNSYNLIWTPYEGFEFASYKLYRGTANNNLQLIQTMPSTLTSFTDNNPAGDALFYQIEVVMAGNCIQNTRDITHTGARSNIVYNGVPVATDAVVEACDSYDWNGEVLTSSGEYTQSFTSVLGYDSVVTLYLTIHPAMSSDFSIECPDSCYTWNGIDYCSSGDYTQTLQTVHGCDSIVTLHLTITVGIDDHALAASMTVYPNPTTGIVKVQCTMNNGQAEAVEFQLFDAFGRLLRTTDGVGANNYSPLQAGTHGSTAQTHIDLSRFTSGIYFIKAVADGNVVAVRKIVKH